MYKHKLIVKNQKKNKSEKDVSDDEESIDEKTSDLVSSHENHIYFYDSVNTKNILTLIKYIKLVNKKLLSIKNDFDIKYDSSVNLNIYLHINSCGGYITDAFAAINYIKNSRIPIISIIDGYAASAATLLSVVCYKRQITEHSTMLIHQLSSCSNGTHEQMKDDITKNVYLLNVMKNIYIENSVGKLTKKNLNLFLKHDLMWNPDKCFKYGLVDEII